MVYLLRRWNQVDIGIPEATNEAEENLKYLCTSEILHSILEQPLPLLMLS